uniref:threonine ammonia-lyase IlvA n=1 Tax=Fulvivirga sp. TaxID=1931237 RepID=UPI0040496E47
MEMQTTVKTNRIAVEKIVSARMRLKDVIYATPTQHNQSLSEKYGANIYLKREDMQIVRSYKIRGAYNKMSGLSATQQQKGIVCASAGNHAQGVALSCKLLGIHGKIFMPTPTTEQKVNKVKFFGKDKVEVVLVGDTFDDAYDAALKDCKENGKEFIHPFEDEAVIEGQGTVGAEILDEMTEPIDYLVLPIGGGGLSAGVGSYIKALSPATKLIGVEPAGAPAMERSFKNNNWTPLTEIDKFVDGAAVKAVGKINFAICQEVLDKILLIPEGKVCTTMLDLYNNEGIIVEPAGALTTAALDLMKDEIKGKTVVCVVSGGNNDIVRMAEIRERSMLYEGRKQYFIVKFPQRAGALREFLTEVLGPKDDIVLFEYTKKTARENGPALIGIELEKKEDYDSLIERMDQYAVNYQLLNNNPELFGMLI